MELVSQGPKPAWEEEEKVGLGEAGRVVVAKLSWPKKQENPA